MEFNDTPSSKPQKGVIQFRYFGYFDTLSSAQLSSDPKPLPSQQGLRGRTGICALLCLSNKPECRLCLSVTTSILDYVYTA